MSELPPEENKERGKSKVLSLLKAKGKEDRASEQKIPQADIYRAISMAIDRDRHSTLPEFPKKFYAVEVAPGIRRVLYETEPDVVSYVPLDALSHIIHQYTEILRPRPQFAFETRHSDAAARYWLYRTQVIQEPRAVSWQGEDGLSFRKLPWTYRPDPIGDQMPLFQELFSRMSNAGAVLDWIGSLFFHKADRQQYVWIYGDGQNGKGSLAYFLGSVFGPSFRSVQPPQPGDKHWTAGLVGSRLVVFSDCNSWSFPTSGLFKSLSGNDRISINEKFEPAYTTELNCKFMFLSNERPALSSAKSDIRRAIYSEVLPLPREIEVDGTYQERLWAEGGAFLSTCIYNYSTSYKHHGPIKVNNADLDDVISENEELFEAIASRCFDFSSPTFRCRASELQEVLSEHFKTEKQKRDFKAYLTRMYKIGKATNQRVDGALMKIYDGFRRTKDWGAVAFFQNRDD